ncbi:hypothetical protein [Klebsiella pneumoniae]|uniref:hypothetical protein n=1 Tax=Klebsiella pneumoniae TaxID=573 RepID=UPI003A8449DC
MTRIAFLDVDGTILEHGSLIAPSTVTAIRQARANGHVSDAQAQAVKTATPTPSVASPRMMNGGSVVT